MQLCQAAAAGVVLCLSLFLLPSTAHNITRILADHPDFSTFNHYSTVTQLAPKINRRETITVCPVDNAGMADLLSKLHQITDGTALAATMFQAIGSAPGSSGFVNITDLKGGNVCYFR